MLSDCLLLAFFAVLFVFGLAVVVLSLASLLVLCLSLFLSGCWFLCMMTTSVACFALSSSCSRFLLFCVFSVFCFGLLWVVSLLVVCVLLMLVVSCVFVH